ncbi:MAG: VOC family protein [Actinomycetia bacterium]|nr:VOC family protein [Actinomycetes bacterium]
MTSRISETTIDCHDAFALATWWKQVLNYTDDPADPNQPDHTDCIIVDPASSQRLLFQQVPEVKQTKNRIHFDLRPTDCRRDAEVERVLALGATQLGDHRNPDGTGWVTLADPEGNEFCIVRSDDERSRTT